LTVFVEVEMSYKTRSKKLCQAAAAIANHAEEEVREGL
jgi:hypothetical protein